MKKGLIKRIVSSLIIILFITGCTASEVTEESKDSSTENSSEYLLADVQEIKAANIKYPDEIHLTFKGQEWETNDLSDVDQEAVNEFLTETMTLSGEITEEIKENNLDESSLILAIEFIDGENQKTELEIYEIQKTFYGRVDSLKDIYRLPAISNEMHYFESFLLDKSIPTAVEDISEISIKNNDEEEILLNQTTSMNEIERSPFISGWYLHEVYETNFSIEYRVMEDILHTLKNLKGLPIENINSLEEYDKVIQISDQENTDYLYIDSKNSQENLGRVWVESTKTVYEVPIFLLNTFSFDPLEVVDNFISVIPLDAMQEIIIEEEGEETIKVKATHDLIEGEEDLEMSSSFFVNDEEVEENNFRKAYQYLIGLSYEQELTEALRASKDSEETIKFLYKYKNADEIIQSEILFQPSNDEEKYMVTKDGMTEFIIDRQEVEEALEQFQNF